MMFSADAEARVRNALAALVREVRAAGGVEDDLNAKLDVIVRGGEVTVTRAEVRGPVDPPTPLMSRRGEGDAKG